MAGEALTTTRLYCQSHGSGPNNKITLKHIIQTTTITITLDLFNWVSGGCYSSSDWVVTVEGGYGGGYGVEEFDSSQGSDCGEGWPWSRSGPHKRMQREKGRDSGVFDFWI
ncbi:hypothetical protein ACE6H2_006071 [Prunus campanulata]